MIKFSYHRVCRGKPDKRLNAETNKNELWQGNIKINLGYGWQTTEQSFEDIYEMLSAGGYAFAPALTSDHRDQTTFVSHQVALVDIDSGMTIDELKQLPFYQKYGSGYYTTPSHTAEEPRFRILYRFEAPVTDTGLMRMVYEGLLSIHGAADASCKDPARLFFGTINAEHREITDRYVDIDGGFAEILQAYIAKEARQPKPQPVAATTGQQFPKKTVEEVAELLDDLRRYYPTLDYHTRRDVTWCVMSEMTGPQTISLMRSRWDDSDSAGKYETTVSDYKRASFHLGTIVIMIRKHNPTYRVTARSLQRMTTEELLALKGKLEKQYE
jgi:hypothetical protein